MVHVRRSADSRLSMAEEFVLRQSMETAEQFAIVRESLAPEHFQSGPRRNLAEAIWNSYSQGNFPQPDELASGLDPETLEFLSRMMLQEEMGSDVDQALSDCIRTILLSKLNEEYETLRLRADEMSRRGDSGYVQELQNAQRILTKISDIAKSL